MLDVDPPKGYAPTLGHDGDVALGEETLETVHGASYVFWLSFFASDSPSPLHCREASEDSDQPPDLDPSERSVDEAASEPNGSQGDVEGGGRVNRSRSPHRHAVDPDTVDGVKCGGHGRRCVATPCRNLVLRSEDGRTACGPIACTAADGDKGTAPLRMPGFHDDALAQCHPADTSVAVASETMPGDLVDVDAPVTLLELASRSDECALVVTAFSAGVPAKEVACGRPLRLHSCIPVPTFDLTRPTAAMQRSLQDVWDLCQPWSVGLFSELPMGFCPHPATCEALRTAIAGPNWGSQPTQVRLFTDGSFDGRK